MLDEQSFLKLAFHWRFHQHPHPFQLFEWSRKWREFVRSIPSGPPERVERILYGWIYYQLEWMRRDMDGLHSPKNASTTVDWNEKILELLDVKPFDYEHGELSAWSHDWRTQTLPLLARPEIGLPPKIQRQLLKFVSSETDQQRRSRHRAWLMDQRERLVTDAIIAAGDERLTSPRGVPGKQRSGQAYRRGAGEAAQSRSISESSPWNETIESTSDGGP